MKPKKTTTKRSPSKKTVGSTIKKAAIKTAKAVIKKRLVSEIFSLVKAVAKTMI